MLYLSYLNIHCSSSKLDIGDGQEPGYGERWRMAMGCFECVRKREDGVKFQHRVDFANSTHQRYNFCKFRS